VRIDQNSPGEYDERLQVAGDEAGEQHEAQLAPGRLDDRKSSVVSTTTVVVSTATGRGRLDDGRLEVTQERDDDDAGGGDAEDGQGGRHDGERAGPVHVLLDETAAAAAVVGRPPAAATRPTRVLVLDVRVVVARRAHPAARVALLNPLPSIGRQQTSWEERLPKLLIYCRVGR